MEHIHSQRNVAELLIRAMKMVEQDPTNKNARRMMAPLLFEIECHISSPISEWKERGVAGDVLDFLAKKGITQFGRQGTKDMRDTLDTSVKTSNLLQVFAGAVGSTGLGLRGYNDAKGNAVDSEFRKRVMEAGGMRGDLIGGELIELDNPDVWEKLISDINKSVDKIFKTKDARLVGNKTEMQDPEQLMNPVDAVDRMTLSLQSEVAKPENNTEGRNLSDSELNKFNQLVQDYAKASVVVMLGECMNGPEPVKDKIGNVVGWKMNGQLINDNTPVDVAQSQLQMYLRYGVNGGREVAKERLDTWMKSKGIKRDSIKFAHKMGKSADSFDGMINEVTKGYFLGYCKVNHGLADFLDKEKLENMIPTQIKTGDKSRWEEWKKSWDEVSVTPRTPGGKADPTSAMRDHVKQKKFFEDNHPKTKAIRGGVPVRAFLDICMRARKLVESLRSSFQSGGYMHQWMRAMGQHPRTMTTISRGARAEMRENFRAKVNMAFLDSYITVNNEAASPNADRNKIHGYMSYINDLSKLRDYAKDEDAETEKLELSMQKSEERNDIAESNPIANTVKLIVGAACPARDVVMDAIKTVYSGSQTAMRMMMVLCKQYTAARTDVERRNIESQLFPMLSPVAEHVFNMSLEKKKARVSQRGQNQPEAEQTEQEEENEQSVQAEPEQGTGVPQRGSQRGNITIDEQQEDEAYAWWMDGVKQPMRPGTYVTANSVCVFELTDVVDGRSRFNVRINGQLVAQNAWAEILGGSMRFWTEDGRRPKPSGPILQYSPEIMMIKPETQREK